jgi:GTP pyrophosphokinase
MEEAARTFGLKSVDELIINVGYGKLTPIQILHKFKEPEKERTIPSSTASSGGRKRRKRRTA